MTNSNQKTINEIDAKGGRRVKGMTAVLAISTISAAIILLSIFAFTAA